MLAVRGMRVGYRKERLVLTDLGFAIEPGRLLTILGPNGVGKTTLLRCLNAMVRPWAGEVLVADQNVFRLRPEQIARRLGYVAQRNEAGRMTAFDAVLLGRKPHLGWRVTRKDLAKVDAVLDRLGLRHLVLRRICDMSGGELQQVCIARALVQEPKVLLLDEPTSSLDLRNQLQILEIVRGVVRQERIIAVLTMHDLNLALRFTDRFLLLKNGRVFAFGPPEQITADMVRAVYGVEVEVLRHKGHVLIVPNGEMPAAAPSRHDHLRAAPGMS